MRNGADFSVFINTAQGIIYIGLRIVYMIYIYCVSITLSYFTLVCVTEFDGSDAGARPEEAGIFEEGGLII